MSEDVQLTRGAFVYKSILKNNHFSMQEKFCICCRKNSKYCGKKNPKKLSEHARLLGNSEYVGRAFHCG